MSAAQVYRAYDQAGRLLYVGCSVDVEARLRYHEEHSYWWPFHARITLTDYESRSEAADAETFAIMTEHPRWNIKDRSQEHPDGWVSAHGRAPWLADEIAVWKQRRQILAERATLEAELRLLNRELRSADALIQVISRDDEGEVWDDTPPTVRQRAKAARTA